MLRALRNRSLSLVPSLLAAALLLAPSAVAQRKKPPPEPAAKAPAAPAAKTPAPAAPKKKKKRKPKRASTAPAAPGAAPEPETETETEPMPEGEAETEKKDAPSSENEGKPSDNNEEWYRDKKTDKDKPARLPSLFELELGMKGFQRHLAYQNDVRNVIPDYDLGGAPAFALSVGIYPVRTATGSVAAGITGGFESAFSLGTTYRQPQPGQDGNHPTSASAYSIGARVNFNFGSSSIGLGTEYGAQNYKVDLPPPTPDNAQVPDVEYRFLRPYASFRIGVGPKLALLASGGYLYLLSAGEIVSPSYFRGAATSASGFDLNLGVGWAPFTGFKAFEVRPMFGWRRIGYTFTTDPNNPADLYIASGAHDDYLSLSLMLGLRL